MAAFAAIAGTPKARRSVPATKCAWLTATGMIERAWGPFTWHGTPRWASWGWFYECASATDPMPMRGRYVDIDRCLYAPVDDVHEMHEEYLVKKEAKTLPWG